MNKFIYNTIGGISLAVGVVGAFLPLLPSTCFILLATWAFAKSSPTFHDWLYYKSPFSQSIQDWHEHRVIPLKVKWIATISIIASYGIVFIVLDNVYVLAGLATGMVVLLIYLYSKPSYTRSLEKTSYLPSPKLHRQVI